MPPHRVEQCIRFGTPCARQTVQVLERQKRQHRIVPARSEMAAEILPTRPDVGARDFEPCEQRHGTDLILRVILGDTPAMPVVEFQNFLNAPLAQIEQRQVPPNVRDHERVQIGPSIRRLFEEAGSLIDPAARQEHMRERVLCPRLLAPHLERGPSLSFRFVQQVALFVGKRGHAVHVGDIRVRRCHLQCHTQHFRRVAAIELEILVRFDDDEIARKFIRYPVAKPQAQGRVVIDPRPQHRRVELLAARGVRRRALGRSEIFCGALRARRRFEQHPQQPRVHVGHARLRLRIRGGENTFRAGFVRQVAFDEIIDAAQRGVV